MRSKAVDSVADTTMLSVIKSCTLHTVHPPFFDFKSQYWFCLLQFGCSRCWISDASVRVSLTFPSFFSRRSRHSGAIFQLQLPNCRSILQAMLRSDDLCSKIARPLANKKSMPESRDPIHKTMNQVIGPGKLRKASPEAIALMMANKEKHEKMSNSVHWVPGGPPKAEKKLFY